MNRNGRVVAAVALLAATTASPVVNHPVDPASSARSGDLPSAQIFLPKLITSRMVLQAETPSLFGWTSGPGYVGVTASFKDPRTGAAVTAASRPTRTATAVPNASAWTVDFPGQLASLSPVEITITASEGGSTVTLTDVLFGDVFLCSGQSNMEFSVAEMFEADAIISSAAVPGIRLFAVQKNGSATRLADIKECQYNGGQGVDGWAEASPTTVCGAGHGDPADYCVPHCAGYAPGNPSFQRPTWGYFSAVCLVHGMRLLEATGRPQGLLASSWGGSEIELWSSKEALAQCPSTWCPGKPPCKVDGLYFAGMIAPLVNFPIRGAIWYQGEANSNPIIRATQYTCQLRALILDWRSRWHRSANFSFGVAQLAPAGDGSHGILRWSQRQVVASVPRSFLTVNIDLYDAMSPCGAVHIRNKTAVGERLALGTLAATAPPSRLPAHATLPFTSSWNVASGPVPADRFTWPVIPFAAKLPLSFRAVEGMTLPSADHHNFETTTVVRPPNGTASWGGWVAARSASLAGDRVTILASAASGSDAVAVRGVRFAWGDVPSNDTSTACLNGRFLYSADNLPLGVFIAECTDDGQCQLLSGTVIPTLATRPAF